MQCGICHKLIRKEENYCEDCINLISDMRSWAINRNPILKLGDKKPSKVYKRALISTKEDERGVLYSCDGKCLVECPKELSSSLTKYIIPEGTEEICPRAFNHCANLESITLPNSLKKIGIASFPKIINIINNSPYFKIEDGLLIQDTKVIAAISDSSSFIIPKYITSIGNLAFMNHKELNSIVLPSKLIDIGDFAFYESHLKSIEFPKGLKSIGNLAFAKCQAINEISIPQKVEFIGVGAFFLSENLKRIEFPKSCEYIAYCTCAGCKSLEEVNFYRGLEIIDMDAFSGCENLKEIYFPSTLKEIEGFAFLGCNSLEKILVPGSIHEIDYFAFEGCNHLYRIDVNTDVEEDDDIDYIREKFEDMLPSDLMDITHFF